MIDYAQCLERYGDQLRNWPLWLWPFALLAPMSKAGAACLKEYRQREVFWAQRMDGELRVSPGLQQRLVRIPETHRQAHVRRLPLWSAGMATTAALILGVAVGMSGLPSQYPLLDEDYQAFTELDFTGSLEVSSWLEEEQ